MADTTTDQQAATTEEQSSQATEDQAGRGGSGVGVDNSAGDSTDDDGESQEEGQIDLIGQERFDALKNDPAALRKELNRAATKKFQQLAKSQEVLRPYVNLIKALDEDPRAAITTMAKQFGIELKEAAKTEEAAQSLDARITESVRAALGEEYGDLADRLGPAIQQVAQMVAEQQGATTRKQLEAVISDSALREANAAIATFEKTHPDYKKHEDAMTELSKKLPPGEEMEEQEYLEILYTLVKRDGATGDGVKKVINKVAKSVENSEKPGSAVSDKHVATTPGKLPTFAEAAAAARRGERFE